MYRYVCYNDTALREKKKEKHLLHACNNNIHTKGWLFWLEIKDYNNNYD